jgi:HAD superfamily hydrolase (TIGR01484 family)
MTSGPVAGLRDRTLVLAVDLDGTFLGGSNADRRALYDLIDRRRAEIALVFVTGRDIPFAAGLSTAERTPAPDVIIGDVGTSIVVGPDWAPHRDVDTWIEARWPGPERAAEIMARRPKLKVQDVFGGRRLSFFYDDPAEAAAASAEIEAAGYAALMSADLYFDVLPRGVNKGRTLLQWLGHEGVARERVLCAGDTMNDLSLFETGLRGVAVGNAEPRLAQAVEGMNHVYRASREGAGGIVEAIVQLDMLANAKEAV